MCICVQRVNNIKKIVKYLCAIAAKLSLLNTAVLVDDLVGLTPSCHQRVPLDRENMFQMLSLVQRRNLDVVYRIFYG